MERVHCMMMVVICWKLYNISINGTIPQKVVKLKMKSIVQYHMHESVEKELDTLDVFDEHGRPIG